MERNICFTRYDIHGKIEANHNVSKDFLSSQMYFRKQITTIFLLISNFLPLIWIYLPVSYY